MAKIILPSLLGGVVRIPRARQPIRKPNRQFAPPQESAKAITWFNDSGQTVPAYAILRVTGAEIADEGKVTARHIVTCAKPNATEQPFYLLNGRTPVAADDFGTAIQWGPALAAYDTADGTPAYGEKWGPESGSWLLHKNKPGFIIIGSPDATNADVLVTQLQTGWRRITITLPAELTAATASLASCPVTRVWSGPDPGATVTAFNELGFTGEQDDPAWADYDESTQQWQVITPGGGGGDPPASVGELVRFELTADLAPGGSATATIIEWDAGSSQWTATGASITVYDFNFHHYGLGAGADFGDWGWAALMPDSERYEVVELNGRVVYGEMDGDVDGDGLDTVTVSVFRWDGSAFVDTLINITNVRLWLERCGKLHKAGPLAVSTTKRRVSIKWDEAHGEWQIEDFEGPHLHAYGGMIDLGSQTITVTLSTAGDQKVTVTGSDQQRNMVYSSANDDVEVTCDGYYRIGYHLSVEKTSGGSRVKLTSGIWINGAGPVGTTAGLCTVNPGQSVANGVTSNEMATLVGFRKVRLSAGDKISLVLSWGSGSQGSWLIGPGSLEIKRLDL